MRWLKGPASPERGAMPRKPGGGVKLHGITADKLAQKILRASERGRAELIVPRRARLLFVLSQLWPELGDWIIRRMT